MKPRAKALAALLILVALLAPTIALVTYKTRPSPQPEPASEREIQLTLPFRRGDTFTLYKVVRLTPVSGNETGPVTVTNGTVEVMVLKPGWPFTLVKIMGSNRTANATIPTVLLGMPREFLGRNITAPITVDTLGDAVCLPLRYTGVTATGESYIGTTPEQCKSLTVFIGYYSNGLLNRMAFHYIVGDTIYTEITELVAWSVSGPSKINVTLDDLRFCAGYYSRSILYTLPGAYMFTLTEALIAYRFDAVLNTTPLLILSKSEANEELWRILPGNYTGGVIVVSPLLRGYWRIPHLDEVTRHGAVLILPGGKTVVGTENVTRYIVGSRT